MNIEDKHIIEGTSSVSVDLTKGSTVATAVQIAELINLNKDKPIVLMGADYTVTFPQGTMTEVEGMTLVFHSIPVVTTATLRELLMAGLFSW